MNLLINQKYSFLQLRNAHIRLGRKGERLACRLVKNLGMEVIHQNYLGPHGEIDIIARDMSILCFIEVKARRRSSKSRPADAVTPEKKRRIIRTAKRYLNQLGNPPVIYRFDIIELVFGGHIPKEVRYWSNEFSSNER